MVKNGTERETRASRRSRRGALKKERANLKKKSERLKSITLNVRKERLMRCESRTHTHARATRERRSGVETRREIRDAFDRESPRKWGERENHPSQVLRRVYREMVEECDRDAEEASERELLRDFVRRGWVREKKVKSEHFLEIHTEEKGVTCTQTKTLEHYYKIHNTINTHTHNKHNKHTHLTTSKNINMMLTTSLRPFHVLDASLAAELEDMFFDAVDSVLPSNFFFFFHAAPAGRTIATRKARRALDDDIVLERKASANERNEPRNNGENERSRGVRERREGHVNRRLSSRCFEKEDESKLLSSIGVPTSLSH